jgi:hypothetical protein
MWSFLSVRPKSSSSTRRSEDADKLRFRANSLIGKGRNAEALEALAKLQALEAEEPRWPHKRGDLLRASGCVHEAAQAYADAAELYELRGFRPRATAMRALAEILEPGVSTRPRPQTSLHPAVVDIQVSMG